MFYILDLSFLLLSAIEFLRNSAIQVKFIIIILLLLGVQYHDLEWIPSFCGRSVTSPIVWSSPSTIFLQIFVGEHVFLPSESSAKRLATCISHFSVGYHNFDVQIWSVFSFVRSFVLDFHYDAPAVWPSPPPTTRALNSIV